MSAPPEKLGLLSATILTAGAVIGAGVYLLPATLGAFGSITLYSWLIAAAGALVLAVVFGLLGYLRPDADGVVAYASEALHPAFGHMSWFVNWLCYWVSNPAIAVAAVGYLAYFFPILREQGWGLGATLALLWLLIGANLIGPRLVARIGGATLIVGLIPILLTIVLGAIAFRPEIYHASWNVSGKPDGVTIGSAVTPIFWAFTGLECANLVARVIDNPKRNLALAALGGVTLAAIVFIASSVAIMGLMPAKALAASSAPFADAIALVAGPLAAGVLAICAFSKASGTLGSLTLSSAEMSRAGAMAGYLPRWATSQGVALSRDLLWAGGLMSLSALASSSPSLGGQFAILINIGVILSLIFYLLCSASLFRIAGDMLTPLGRIGARTIAALGAGFCLWVLATADPSLRWPTLATVTVSLILWALSRLRKGDSEP